MSKVKRLFLFAGYNPNGHITDALIYYAKSLSKMGDVVLCMDSTCPKSETDKIKPYCVHVIARRHGEYDFGSYKRAYEFAKKSLKQYDYVYLINDSVYGPLYDLKQYLSEMESWGLGAFGMVKNPKLSHPHIQSWFIGMNKCVFLSDWFDEFIMSVTHQDSKTSVTYLYEHGFTKLLNQYNITWKCLYTCIGRHVYNDIKKLYLCGMPFMKKVAFNRHNGALGHQINYVLNRINKNAHDAILSDARDTLGDKYVSRLLTNNPIKILYRNITYTIHKLSQGKL